MHTAEDIHDRIGTLKAEGAAFAVATVVRTVSLTAAKAGAKALIRANGSIDAGWIGGGCARAAVLRAAQAAIADGRPRLVSIQPPDVLEAEGAQPGMARDGREFERNLCPSQGSMDVFVEPVLPRPEILVCGGTPVAVAPADLARRFGYAVRVAAPEREQPRFAEPDSRHTEYAFAALPPVERYIVVATQGRGDAAALKAALAVPARNVSFVGSRRKIAAIRESLASEGVDPGRLEAVRAPAGVPIDAVTPDEIALSILAEIIAVRRRQERGGV
jgi:xanthine dehydrogenase accessory factor